LANGWASARRACLLMPVGAWVPAKQIVDNWRTSAWARISTDIETPFAEAEEKEHF